MATINTSAELPCSAKKAFDAWLSEKITKEWFLIILNASSMLKTEESGK